MSETMFESGPLGRVVGRDRSQETSIGESGDLDAGDIAEVALNFALDNWLLILAGSAAIKLSTIRM